ncbi:hypothetical protein PhCBS80983_g01633 [Powellomyces hirtus]|uniref:Uncharacterized protein n=1 Tax=Powellomyces hirtus TaxID=109895 RepID=A0A507E9Z7_9FUNG|nr:hypothetical protein PhCBS80983_g01633 [Powellomyces hirtus]
MPLPSYNERKEQLRASTNNLYSHSTHNLYNATGASAGGFGGSATNLEDPEAALEGQESHHQPQNRRGSIMQVFSNELKKSWTSLGSLTAHAASALMGSSPLNRNTSSNEMLPGAGNRPRSTFDEESGSSANRAHSTNPGNEHTVPGGLMNYLSSPRGSTAGSDQHLLPRHNRGYGSQGTTARGRSNILPP